MRTVDFKLILCVKITSCAACRQIGDIFLFVIDLPARHHSAVSTNLWLRGSSLHKGNLGEGKGGEGEEGVGCSNEMKNKKYQQVKIDSPHRIRLQSMRGFFYANYTCLFILLCSGGLESSSLLALCLPIILLSLRLIAL